MKVDRFLESTGLQASAAVTYDTLKTILEGEDPPEKGAENTGNPGEAAPPATGKVATPSPATPAPGSSVPGGIPVEPA